MSMKLKKTLALILSLVTVFSAAFTSMAEVEVVEEVDQIVVPEEPVSVEAELFNSTVTMEEEVSVLEVEEVLETDSAEAGEVAAGTNGEKLLGTGEKVFKAVYDTTDDQNILTFFYDDIDHGGERITVFASLPTAANESWPYDSIAKNVNQVVIDSSVADYTGLTSTAYMFYNFNCLTEIKGLNNLNTSSVRSMVRMFANCSALTSLDLSGFNTARVSKNDGTVASMFEWCTMLITIYASEAFDVSTAGNTRDMFFGCNNLKGGAGTTYDYAHTDKAYARIDGGPESSTPGYFTEKEKYTVTFDSNGGSEIEPSAQTVAAGGTVTEPSPAPTKEGSVFDGWFSDKTYPDLYDFNTSVTESFTLYAKWLGVLELPTEDITVYTYNGKEQTYKPTGFDPDTMTMTNGTQKAAGEYTVTVSPKPGYAWAGGAADPTFTWVINQKSVQVDGWTEPYSKIYDGKPLEIGINCSGIIDGDDCKLSFTITNADDGREVAEAKDLGTYFCVPGEKLSGEDSANYQLSGSVPDPQVYTITLPQIARPTADPNSYTYNGENQTYSPAGFVPDIMVMTNDVQKDAGTYEVKVSPAEGYTWSGGATDPISFTWFIRPAIIGDIQWYTTESKSYDGKALDTGIKALDGVISGDDCKLTYTLHKDTADGEVVSSATEVGTYVCVTDQSLSGTAAGNYELDRNITLPLRKTYTITPKTDPKPDPKPDPDPKPVNNDTREEHEPLYTGTWNSPVKSGSWSQDAHGIWHYASSETFRNTWGYIVNPYAKEGQHTADWFWFDRQGNMLTGWQFINGKWYYLNPSKDGTLGACQLGGVTPDGWTVDESGAWIESIPRK